MTRQFIKQPEGARKGFRPINFWVCLFLVLGLGNSASAHDSPQIQSLTWLSGTWSGTGTDGEGNEGSAGRHFSTLAENTMSATFQWHKPSDAHIHYAFATLAQEGLEVHLRFLHFGRDFNAFEDQPRVYRLVGTHANYAQFECLANCSADFDLELLKDGRLKERWLIAATGEPDLVIHYRKVHAGRPLALLMRK